MAYYIFLNVFKLPRKNVANENIEHAWEAINSALSLSSHLHLTDFQMSPLFVTS